MILGAIGAAAGDLGKPRASGDDPHSFSLLTVTQG